MMIGTMTIEEWDENMREFRKALEQVDKAFEDILNIQEDDQKWLCQKLN